MGNSMKSAQYLIEGSLAGAARGDPAAYFDLGIAFSTGSGGVDVDLVQAHKWFNLAALGGNREGQQCRADVSAEMSRDELPKPSARRAPGSTRPHSGCIRFACTSATQPKLS